MEEAKPWYTSKTIWGSIIAIVSPLVGVIFHVNLSAESAALSDALAAVGSGIGGLLAIYGRVKTTAKIGSRTQ